PAPFAMAAEPKPNAATETNVTSVLRSICPAPPVKLHARANLQFNAQLDKKFNGALRNGALQKSKFLTSKLVAHVDIPERFARWASIAARWRISAVRPPRRRRQSGGRPMLRCLRMPSA